MEKFKKIPFSQFKQICLDDLIKHIKWIGKMNGEYKFETEPKINNIKIEIKKAKTYQDISEIYGYFGFGTEDIISLLVKTK